MVKVEDQWLEVVGVLEPKTLFTETVGELAARDLNTDVYVPLTTFLNRFNRENPLASEIQQITVQVENSGKLLETSRLIDEILKRHHFNNNDYSIVIPFELLKQEEKERRIYNFLLGAIAAISLIVGGIFALAVFIGVIAGSYPAIRLSSLPLGDAAKGGGMQKKKKHGVQNVLVVLQFAISVGLIVCTLVVSKQLSFINDKDTGMDRSRIINLSMTGRAVREREPLLNAQLENLPGIVAVTSSNSVPVAGLSGNGYLPEGMENVMMINLLNTDDHFLDVYGIKLKTGRFFRNGDADLSAFVINESLAKTLGWGDDAIGKYISRDGRKEVIGVVQDFNYESLYNEIAPLIISNRSNEGAFNVISIKYNTGDVTALIGRIRDVWAEVNPDSPFEFRFLDDVYNSIYKSEQQFRALFFSFAFIAIVLAVLGMLSLMAYTIEQRKKEIGIRKVLGASVLNVLQLLLRRTAVQVIIANVIAWPVAWWFTNKWLENFAYRIQISWTIFILALFISAFIALIAVAFQAIKAATVNPLESLKTE
jgi:putative ABC transport system permease protein